MEVFPPLPHPHRYRPAAADTAAPPPPCPLPALIAALNHASANAHHLPALRAAHSLLSAFLANPPPPPTADVPMADADDVPDATHLMEEVEEGIRDCTIRSKRRKRRASPLWIGGRCVDQREEPTAAGAVDRRQAAIELVFQFHA